MNTSNIEIISFDNKTTQTLNEIDINYKLDNLENKINYRLNNLEKNIKNLDYNLEKLSKKQNFKYSSYEALRSICKHPHSTVIYDGYSCLPGNKKNVILVN